jgi:DnaJ like chaperone protein
MSWWGKVIGGTLGAAVAGPIGALLGAAIGHGFDTGLKGLEMDADWRPDTVDQVERSKAVFFTSTFLAMGTWRRRMVGCPSRNSVQRARSCRA